MIEERGLVVRCRESWAEIETERGSSCGNCSAQSGCGVSFLDRLLGRRPMRLAALNRIGAEAGQRVVVGMPERGILSAAIAAYLVPILGLIGGSSLGQELAPLLKVPAVDLVSLGGGMLGLATGFLWLARFSRARAQDARYRAVVLRLEAAPPAAAGLGVPAPAAAAGSER